MKLKLDGVKEIFLDYGLKIFMAIGIVLIGLFIIGLVRDTLNNIMKKRNKDETLRTFTISLIDVVLKLMLFLTVISMLGVQIASFIAILGAAGVAIGLALQGSLSNLAAGVLILFFRPFTVGNYIEVKSYAGKVKEIQIFHTVLITNEGIRVIIPNATLSSGNIIIHTDK